MAGAIILNPTHAKVGTSVLITGSGFTAADTMSFTYGGVTIVPTEAPIVVAGDGTLPTCHIVIPASVQGVHAVVATDAHSVSGSANFTVDSFISLSPTTQKIGGSTTVTGTGFATLSAVTITIGGVTVTGVTTDADGGFAQAETVPTLTSGSQTVSATDAALNNATATLTVSAPTLALSPTSGIVGTVITLTGSNYIPSHALTITNVDGSTSSATADASGNIPAATTISIASFPKGSHNVTVSDGTNTGTASFTISQSITLDPTSGPSTTEVLVTGTGFATTSAITIKVDGVTVTTNPASITSDGTTGAFTGSTTLASLADGAHTISATDASSNTFSATFTVSQTLKLTSIINDLNVGRVYKWGENIELEADDTSYADAVVLDTRNAANVLMTLYNAGGQTMDYATYGIIHESNNTVPPTDTAGIKKWIPIDVDQSLATTVSGSKLYQNILWSYILVRVKLAAATAATTIEFSAKTIDKNG